MSECPSALWWREGVLFTCKGCGDCCAGEPGAVWLTEKEQKRIAEHLCLSDADFKGRYLKKFFGRTSLRECANYDCILLKRNPDMCSVYKVRPLQCRLFPFWPSVMRDKASWDYHASRCPGMGSGKLYTADVIAKLLQSAPWSDL